jgi:hypothetical protein
MKKLVLFNLLFVALIGSTFTSCSKDETKNEDQVMEQTNAVIEHELDQATNFSDEAYNTGTIASDLTSDEMEIRHNCAIVTLDTSNSMKTITIDFGNSNCLGRDGRYRRGKIITTFEGRYRAINSTHTITFVDYFVNDNHLEGTRNVTNTGADQNGKTTFTVTDEGKVTLTDGLIFTYISQRIRTWTEGESTFNIWDDVYSISGSGSVANSKGNGFTATIQEPLTVALNCSNITKGIIRIMPLNNEFKERVINYGDGNCDDLASVTVNGVTKIIKLR